MVKFTTPLFVAALVAAPAFASISWDQIDARDLADYDEPFGRGFSEAEATVFTRDYDELFSRHPDDLGLDSREYEDIARRKRIGAIIRDGMMNISDGVKNIIYGTKNVISSIVKKKKISVKREEDQDEVFAREYDEIDARDPDIIYQRYTDELETRAPGIFKNILQNGMKVVKAIAYQGEKKPEAKAETPAAEPAPEAAARDFDDLSERDFFDEDLVERDFDEGLYEREYVEDLYERDFDLDLVERDLFDLEERSFDDLD